MGTNLGLALRCTFDQAYFAQVGVFTNADFEQMYVDFPLFKSTGAADAGEMTLGQRIGILSCESTRRAASDMPSLLKRLAVESGQIDILRAVLF